MPANRASLQITEAYRGKMVALRERAQHDAREVWGRIDQRDLDGTYEVGLLAVLVTAMQREAARLSSGYLQAFIQSELGRPIRAPMVDARQVGQARNGDELRKALVSPLITAKVAIKDGKTPTEALVNGRTALDRMVGLATDTAARESLRRGMEDSSHVEGWRRAVRGTCGACMGASKGRVEDAGETLHIHPNCQCVSEPVVRSGAPPVKVLTKAGSPAEGMAKYNSSFHGSARSQLSIAERRALDEAMDAMRKAHRWPEADAIPVRPVDSTGQGMAAFRQSGGVPQEITVSEGLGIDQTATSVAHEMGHYLDNLLSKQMVADRVIANRGFATEWPGLLERGIRVGDSEVGTALKEFLEVARASPTMRIAKSSLDEAAWEYINAPEEIWARAYSQWVTGRLSKQSSWEIGDFEPVGEAVEKVLKAAKLR